MTFQSTPVSVEKKAASASLIPSARTSAAATRLTHRSVAMRT